MKLARSRTFPRRPLHPHLLRHSCAVALLQSGVDLTVIRDYLGHASVATTNRYVSTNLKMKRDALTASDVHHAVQYRPITRYDTVGGYTAAALPEERIR